MLAVYNIYIMTALPIISLDNLQNRITVYFILSSIVQSFSKKLNKKTAVNWVTFYKDSLISFYSREVKKETNSSRHCTVLLYFKNGWTFELHELTPHICSAIMQLASTFN